MESTMTEFEMFLFVVGVACGTACTAVVFAGITSKRRDEERRRLMLGMLNRRDPA
jgi:hypothetical protein